MSVATYRPRLLRVHPVPWRGYITVNDLNVWLGKLVSYRGDGSRPCSLEGCALKLLEGKKLISYFELSDSREDALSGVVA
jgi:hypothetical protein